MTKPIRRLTVSRVSDTPGYEYRAELQHGSSTWGRYGSTADEAVEKIRTDFNSDLVAEVVKTRSYCGTFADGSAIVLDANGMIEPREVAPCV